ncbi:hypothetical protein DERP_004477 [Dermatophagoides pteronyssinus]|uniref:Uncharacterized protein n=1 Tax=Dermatophagoides pteronyssinus TaxID=6956 RepID=A0ABQ8JNW4_DERPT|nr:hypothetical protein DERP_004477 [Dermatophagoides pteronyssinus]
MIILSMLLVVAVDFEYEKPRENPPKVSNLQNTYRKINPITTNAIYQCYLKTAILLKIGANFFFHALRYC